MICRECRGRGDDGRPICSVAVAVSGERLPCIAAPVTPRHRVVSYTAAGNMIWRAATPIGHGLNIAGR